ncbi:MAG: ParA family protein [Magnetococcus sp. DMHC-1]
MIGHGSLFSWVDISRWLWESYQAEDVQNVDDPPPPPPDGLIYAQAYWDGLQLGVAKGTNENDVFQWLEKCFSDRWDHNSRRIILTTGTPDGDQLSVVLEELSHEEEQEWKRGLIRAQFSPPGIVRFHKTFTPFPPDLPPELPPLVLFHSFKGGVGRTMCALGLAQAYASRKKKVLLIDADFEAPGISFLYSKRLGDPLYSLSDLINMVHADPDVKGEGVLTTAHHYVQSQELDGIFVLPGFRNMKRMVSLEIRPEHLVSSVSHPPFFFTETLARLGKMLGVDVVIVDLRAGLSELSAFLLLDPRVHRLLVVNASGQAIQGTRLLLQQMGRMARTNQWPESKLPGLILNQLPLDIFAQVRTLDQEKGMLASILDKFDQMLAESFMPPPPATENEQPLILSELDEGFVRALIPYNPLLAILPDDWDGAMASIKQANIPDTLWKDLELWLPKSAGRAQKKGKTPLGPPNIEESRKKLGDYAGSLITAEGRSNINDQNVNFLAIQPLEKLAIDHAAKLPVTVVIGAKGAGKTYTYLNLAKCGTWGNFFHNIKKKSKPGLDAMFLPLLWNKNSDNMTELQNIRIKCRTQIGLTDPGVISFELAPEISRFLSSSPDIWQWRTFWIDAMAWVMGINPGQKGEGEKLLKFLHEKKQFLIAIVDGLEEAFVDFSSDPRQQTALRSLLQEVPNWLRQQHDTLLGLIVFVRQDIVVHAIPQNRTQFIDKYRNYALQWRWAEAMELAAWVTEHSGAIPGIWKNGFAQLLEGDQARHLTALWGMKLGNENSREPRSNEWVLSSLADLRGRIQARDIVRFLQQAANKSIGNTKTTDRLLSPSAMRDALSSCGEAKVQEIGEENIVLNKIFQKIRESRQHENRFSTPCRFEALARIGLEKNDIEMMEENGVVFFDNREGIYHFPEIFRHGLGIDRNTKAKPKIISLMRQARNLSRF